MFNEEWKIDGQTPSVEDCRKYAHCRTRLLAQAEHWSTMLEIFIARVTNGGMIQVYQCAALGMFGVAGMWMRPEDLTIIEILPDIVTPDVFAPKKKKRKAKFTTAKLEKIAKKLKEGS